MRTSPMSALCSLPPMRGSPAHPPNKRRRIIPLPSNVQERVLQAASANQNATMLSKAQVQAHTSTSISRSSLLTCVSCYRMLMGTGAQRVITCSRCSSPMCAICSRTCTSRSQPSLPSATNPQVLMVTTKSQKRTVLGLNSPNTNFAVQATGKRKKIDEDLSREDSENAGGADRACEVDDVVSRQEYKSEDGGCGRTVCKECCVENTESDLTSCLDCLSH